MSTAVEPRKEQISNVYYCCDGEIDKIRIAKPDRNAVKGAKAARMQRSKMVISTIYDFTLVYCSLLLSMHLIAT